MSLQVFFFPRKQSNHGYGSPFPFVPSVPFRLFPNNGVLLLNWERFWYLSVEMKYALIKMSDYTL